jgi:hypothetical protein
MEAAIADRVPDSPARSGRQRRRPPRFTRPCQDGSLRVFIGPRSQARLAAGGHSAPQATSPTVLEQIAMAKPHRRLKKANHGARPANSKARKMKRKHIRT